jgi:cell division protein FtsA
VAENVKIKYGDCRPKQIDPNIVFPVEPFGGEKIQVGRQDLAYVIEARVEEIFKLILQAVQQSGYDGLLPAGIVLTGGTAQLRGITEIAERVLNVPARVASPRNLLGLVDDLHSPAFATAVGLLHWARTGSISYRPRVPQRRQLGRRVGTFLRALLPG